MSECGVCGKIVTAKGIACDGGCAKWYHRICVRMTHEQYQEHDEDYRREYSPRWV